MVNFTPQYSLIEVYLLTGKRNQIRVQFASRGHSILGDNKYGNIKTNNFNRLFLHASYLKINHPTVRNSVVFKTPVPPEFNEILSSMEKLL